MKNYEVLIVIFAGLGIAYYMAKKTQNSGDSQQEPLGNISVVSAQSPRESFPATVPPCCIGLGGVRLQPTTMIPAICKLVPPECIA